MQYSSISSPEKCKKLGQKHLNIFKENEFLIESSTFIINEFINVHPFELSTNKSNYLLLRKTESTTLPDLMPLIKTIDSLENTANAIRLSISTFPSMCSSLS